MNTRASKFVKLAEHPWYAKQVSKLTKLEVCLIYKFCQDHADLDADAFEMKANRYYLTNEKTKNWALVNEILSVLAKG